MKMIMEYWWNNTDLGSNTGLCGKRPATYRLSHVTAVSANNFFPRSATAPVGSGRPHYRGFMITLRHTAPSRNPLDE